MKRALLVALPAVLALGLVACGDDDDNTSATAPDTATVTTSATAETSGTTEPSDTSGGGEITLPGGGTIDIGSILPGGSLPDLSIPDLSIPDLSLPGGSIPDLGSLVPQLEDILQRTFPNLTDAQISCLADHLQGEDRVEMSQITAIMGECDIDLQDLIGG